MIRSRASSLYISFTPLYSLLYSTPPSTTRKEETAARELLSYLALYASERWKVFSLCWKEHFSLNDSNQAISTILSRATHLEHLTFHHDLERYRNTFFTMQSSTVNLRHLTSLAIIDTQWSRLVFASPLPSVQYLTLGWNRGCCWASLMYTRACGVKESAMDHSFQSEYDCVHWLSLFPTLQSLHLVSHQEESEYVSPFHPHISNASGINGPQPVSGTSHAMANDLYDRMHSPPFYEARRLHTMILEGPVPAWVLHGTLFSSLRTLKIISNRRGVNVWEKGRQYPGSVWDWRDVDLSATTELVLDCGGSEFGSHKRPFWRIQDVYNGDEPRDNRYSEKKETVDTIIQAFISNSKNQGYIRDTFDALPNLKVVKAPSCVWKVIKDSFCIPGTRGNIASLIAYATCGGWNTAEDFTSDGEKSYQDEDFSHLYRDYDINESEPVDREVISSEEIQEPSTEPFDPCLGPFEIPADIVRAALGTVVLK
ncbi:hypothetical protein FRB91_001787 [Serendipita sp. 411]|nr:hypothetical protein FRB91_001787 [Serendipita sp. 411]